MLNENNNLEGRKLYVLKAGSVIRYCDQSASEEEGCFAGHFHVKTAEDILIFIEDEEVKINWRGSINERV